MNKISPVYTISPAEMKRRAKVVSKANWSVAMEGLGDASPEYNELSQLWIEGSISRDELRTRRHAMVRERNALRV